MRFKIGELMDMRAGLAEISEIKMKDLTMIYRIAKNYTKIDDVLKAAEMARRKIAEQYGQPDGQGGLDLSHSYDGKKALQELSEMEHDLELDVIEIEKLGSAEISPRALILCGQMIKWPPGGEFDD